MSSSSRRSSRSCFGVMISHTISRTFWMSRPPPDACDSLWPLPTRPTGGLAPGRTPSWPGRSNGSPAGRASRILPLRWERIERAGRPGVARRRPRRPGCPSPSRLRVRRVRTSPSALRDRDEPAALLGDRDFGEVNRDGERREEDVHLGAAFEPLGFPAFRRHRPDAREFAGQGEGPGRAGPDDPFDRVASTGRARRRHRRPSAAPAGGPRSP